MSGKFILETDRLILREFDEDDALAFFFLLGSDPQIIRYTGDPGGGLASIEQAVEGIRSRPMADYRKHGFGRWACVLKETGAVIGFAGLKHLDERNEIDVGYRFLPAYWGAGLATEASRATLAYGFDHLHLERIIGLVMPDNLASVRVLEKIGLRYSGIVNYSGQMVAHYVIEKSANSTSSE